VAATAAYTFLNLRFRLSVDGKEFGAFSECTGLSLEVATEDYHEGGENQFVHKLPTFGQPPNLVLKRGITSSDELWNWFEEYLKTGTVTPKDGQVELLSTTDPDRHEEKPVRVWAFTRGWPVKWTGPELNALSPGVAFETLELVHRGLRVKPPQ
jgi:phage tail-like protein